MKIKVPGKGGTGKHGGKNGDLFLKLKISPADGYEALGKDLIKSVSVPPWDIALGGTLKIDLFGEALEVKIPKKSRGGEQIRLKGKGLKNRTGEGDLLLTLQVQMPEHLSREELDLLRQLKELHEE